MSRVRFSGPNNSTFFTTCCGCAINDYQERCPVCREQVYPYPLSDGEHYSEHQVNMARWNLAYGPYRAADRARGSRP